MPVLRKDLKENEKPLPERIFFLLKENKNKAFTVSEIISEIEKKEPDLLQLVIEIYEGKGLFLKYRSALKELLSKNMIEEAQTEGNIYFAIKED